MHVEPGWQDFLDHHPAHAIVVPKESALANILLETQAWQLIYSDTVASAFIDLQYRRISKVHRK
jgi:hypothetical protein